MNVKYTTVRTIVHYIRILVKRQNVKKKISNNEKKYRLTISHRNVRLKLRNVRHRTTKSKKTTFLSFKSLQSEKHSIK